MKQSVKVKFRVIGFLAISLTMFAIQADAAEDRIASELAASSHTIPLKEAMGEKAYNDAMASGQYQYVGNSKCRLCHREFFLGRKEDHHDFAMDTLKTGAHQDNASCLTCHATGFGVPSGFVNMTETPRLANVQCEGCHGPGNVHIDLAKQQMRSKKKEPVHGFLAGPDNPVRLKKMCLNCHTERWNRSFDDLNSAYNKYRKALPK